MANLPLELFAISKLDDTGRERIDNCYGKLLGLCRWFNIGMNGVLFPVEQGDASLNEKYLVDLTAGRSSLEGERVAQFVEKLRERLMEYDLGYEGTLGILDPEGSPESWEILRVAYAGRAFWRWY